MKTRQIPIVVNGGLDTKTNPKLVQAGAALQIDNMFQQRTGEWRPRNGMTTQPSGTRAISSVNMPYASPSGAGVSGLARGISNVATFAPATPARYGTLGTGAAGWEGSNGTNQNSYFPFPSYVASTVGLFADGTGDVYDGDFAVNGTIRGVIANGVPPKFYDGATARIDDYATSAVSWSSPRMCSTQNYLIAVGLNGAGPFSLQIIVYGTTTYTPGSLAGVVSASAPWFDVSPIPATDKVMIAYNDTASGHVACAVVDASTGTVTGPSVLPFSNASQALGFIDNSLSGAPSTTKTLVCADGTAGLYCVTVNSSSLTPGANIVADNTATANVRQVTGHWDSTTQITLLYEISSATGRIYDTIMRARVVSGVPATMNLGPSFSLYSRTALGPDGKWYFIGAYDSPIQGSYVLLTVDDYTGTSFSNRTAPVCQVMAGEGGGRRAAQSCVTSLVASGSTFLAALPRKKRVTISGVSAQQGRILQLATFSDVAATASRPRELGGVTYIPGGLVYADDGQNCRAAVFPRYIEQPSLAPGNFGSTPPWNMTPSKTYGYRIVLKRQDSAGRIMRSAGSVPVQTTLGPSHNGVAITIPNPYLNWTDFRAYNVAEIYRVGPIENGATLYNLVATVPLSNHSGDTFGLNDGMSDATAATQEVAYFTGNVEENIAPPATSLLEVNGDRVWVVNAEDPTELWPSKQSKTGYVVGFTPDFAFRVDGDGRGPITALGSMDGRLIVFKDGAIWVVSGDGPNDVDQGSFSAPQLASRDVGVPAGLARSVVSVPDGLMFQSARGIYLLDRGLGLTYIGAPVEAYTLAANVVDASQVRGTTQVRFVMASGRTLVWDFQAKTWSTFLLPTGGSSIVACVDANAGWYVVTADGKLRLEVAGATSDDGAAIVPVISLPHLNFAGLSGYQRVRSLDLLLDVVGACALSVDAEFNYSGALTGAPRTISLAAGAGTVQVEYLPPDGMAKCTAMRPVITVSGAPTGGTFRLTSVTATVGVKGGTNIPDRNRMT